VKLPFASGQDRFKRRTFRSRRGARRNNININHAYKDIEREMVATTFFDREGWLEELCWRAVFIVDAEGIRDLGTFKGAWRLVLKRTSKLWSLVSGVPSEDKWSHSQKQALGSLCALAVFLVPSSPKWRCKLLLADHTKELYLVPPYSLSELIPNCSFAKRDSKRTEYILPERRLTSVLLVLAPTCNWHGCLMRMYFGQARGYRVIKGMMRVNDG